MPKSIVCHFCEGSGAVNDSYQDQEIDCPSCRGTGIRTYTTIKEAETVNDMKGILM